MREIKVSELTLEEFKPFGSFARMINPTARGNGVGGMAFYADLEILELGDTHAAAFSTTRVTNQMKPVIVALERHPTVARAFSPWTGICWCISHRLGRSIRRRWRN